MLKRTIMIFPTFDNIGVIDQIREKYDPLANNVRPHITLVFTFESELDSNDLQVHLKRILSQFSPFKLKMGAFVEMNNVLGKYVFLLIDEGIQEIKAISKALYSDCLNSYKPGWLTEDSYLPHMTVGQCSTDHELETAFKDVQRIQAHFTTLVKTISVEIIDENEDSIIDFEVDLK